MRISAAFVVRAFTVTNVLMVVVGLYFLFDSLNGFIPERFPAAEFPHFAQVYYTMTAIDLACLLALLLGTPFLWRLERRGLVICNAVFGFEILYLLGNAFLGLALAESGAKARLLGDSMAAASGIGRMGTVPQIVTGYPIIGLIVLNIFYRRLSRRGSGEDKTHQPAAR